MSYPFAKIGTSSTFTLSLVLGFCLMAGSACEDLTDPENGNTNNANVNGSNSNGSNTTGNSSTNTGSGPVNLIMDDPPMAEVKWSDSDNETVSLCGVLENNTLHLTSVAGLDCGDGLEPIVFAQLTGDTVSLTARATPVVEILDVGSTEGTLTSPSQIREALPVVEDGDINHGELPVRIHSADDSASVEVNLALEHHPRNSTINIDYTYPAAFNFSQNTWID